MSAKHTPEEWDKEYVYDEEIAPLMTEIITICKREQIPMLASFTYRKTEDGGSRCTTHLGGPDEQLDKEFVEALAIIKPANPFFAAYTINKAEGAQ